MDDEVNLNSSIAKLGRLVPIIKDSQGNIIDGLHRQQIDPAWEKDFSVTLENVKGPVGRLLAKMGLSRQRLLYRAYQQDGRRSAGGRKRSNRRSPPGC